MVIRPSFTIREHAPAATVETLLILLAVPWLVFFLRPYPWSAASLSRVERRGKDRPRKSSRVGWLNGRNIERKRKRKERERDSPRIFTTGPLINTHWVTGCLLCRNWALGALYPPFTIWMYPRKLALWDGKELLSFSPYFSSLLSLSFSTHALFTDFCKWWPAVRSRAFVRG